MSNKRFYLWAIIYKSILEIVYFTVVTPVYSYSNLVWFPNWGYFILSNILFVFLLILIPKGQGKPSQQLTQLFFFTTIVPLLSFFWVTSQDVVYVILVTCCCIVLFVLLRISKSVRIPLLRFEKNKKSIKIVHLIFIASILILGLFTLKYGGIDVRAYNFESVYDMRAETQYVGIWGYLVNWVSKLFIPFCLVIYLIERKKVMFLLSCLMQVYFYLCTGSKTTLFSVVFLMFCIYLLKNNKWKSGIPKMYSIIILVSTGIYYLTGYLMAIAIFPVRQLIIPAQISFLHYDFFSSNEKIYFSEGLIGKLLGLKSPYAVHSTFLVSPNTANANTGMLADAFDNGGLLTMIVYTLILGFVFIFVDSMSRNSSNRFMYTALLAYAVIILNDGSLLTTLVTGGLGIMLIFIYFNSSQENHMKFSNEFRKGDKSTSATTQ